MTTRDIELVPHDPAWARLFAEESGALESALSPWLAGAVEHIGSTSVPSLAAKPIVDMMAPIRDLAEAVAAIPAVVSLGYAHSVHQPAEAHYFFKPVVENWWERTHQLHLTEPTTVLWLRRIAFRDALREREDYRSRPMAGREGTSRVMCALPGCCRTPRAGATPRE